jgi:molecular chaperone HscB
MPFLCMVTSGQVNVNHRAPAGACKVPLMTADPFDILGVPPRFDLSPSALERAYLTRSAALHPDASQGPEADHDAAVLNQAKQALEDPERRAEALLARLGGPAKDADRSLPPDFLPEIMEVRESAEAARDARDTAQLAKWDSWAQAKRDGYTQSVARRFAALPPSPAPADLRAIRTDLNAWRYIERMIEQLDLDYNPGREFQSRDP